MSSFMIRVPASSANIGPGFDSMGLAVDLYLTLEVTEQTTWEFISPSAGDVPFEENFIYTTAKQTAERHGKTLRPALVEETTSIPLARGLGSSAAAIVAGIELANQLGDLGLSQEEKLAYATEIEGHPDNVAPALLGGLIISTYKDEEIDWLKIDQLGLELIALIPAVELKTKAARDVLPEQFSIADAALGSGIGNVTVAALISGDYELAGKMMEKDIFHEPYRKSLIPNYDLIQQTTKEHGAFGTVISGAGPTMMSFVPQDRSSKVITALKEVLPDYRLERMKMDTVGLIVESK
ncbi:homoserine kinase [Oceanobacillus alkalisoli]|uniref:homoserine kinase n=1 Tax=Oceanobacillus alkalisoli TaxID=2925113 RepID=UPI001EE42C3E|nr:homoserine kinase [Oceanobacillus alkalisoli]MCG5104917.1 homoserine kinase [Oceanobacillus alkalisoli]